MFTDFKTKVFFGILSLCLLFHSGSEAALFKAGFDVDPVLSAKQTATKIFDDEEQAFEHGYKKALTELESSKAFEVTAALRFLSKNLKEIDRRKKLDEKLLNRIIGLLASPSKNVRLHANGFFRANMGFLIKRRKIQARIVHNFAEKIYDSNEHFTIFLSLIRIILEQKVINTAFLNPEFGFNIIDGLYIEHPAIPQMAAAILKKDGRVMIETSIMEQSHVTRFVTMLKDIPESNYENYLQAFEKNLGIWIERQLISKKDIQDILRYILRAKGDMQERLFAFLTKKETTENLTKLGIFDRSWAVKIKSSIMSADEDRSQIHLTLLAHLIPSFVDAGAFTKADFEEIWKYMQIHLEQYSDPFLLVKKNFRNLSRFGWYTQKDYALLLEGFPKQSESAQREIILLVDELYDWLRLRGWLSITPLSRVLLDHKNDNRNMIEMKMSFLERHIDLVAQKGIFSHEQLSSFLKYLDENDPEILYPTWKVVDNGLSVWIKSGILTKKMFEQHFIADLNSMADRTSKHLEILKHHLPQSLQLLDKDMAEELSILTQSTNPQVAKAAEDFFRTHAETLKENSLLSKRARSNLRDLKLFKREKKR